MSGVSAPAPGLLRMPVRYSRTLLIRGTAIWVLSRFMVTVLYLLIAGSAGSETAAAFTQANPLIRAGWSLVLSAALIRLDLYRRHEVALLNNLGVVTWHAVILGTVPAIVMETTMAILR